MNWPGHHNKARMQEQAMRQEKEAMLREPRHGKPPEDPDRKPGLLKRFWRALFGG